MPAGSVFTGAYGSAGAYLLCSTPRTGSTLLCGLLESHGSCRPSCVVFSQT